MTIVAEVIKEMASVWQPAALFLRASRAVITLKVQIRTDLENAAFRFRQ